MCHTFALYATIVSASSSSFFRAFYAIHVEGGISFANVGVALVAIVFRVVGHEGQLSCAYSLGNTAVVDGQQERKDYKSLSYSAKGRVSAF